MIDSTIVPVRIDFDENEQKIFNGMKQFVSAPAESTESERQELLEKLFGDCQHTNVERWNHGYHSRCRDCGEEDV